MQPTSRYEKLGFKQILERSWLDFSINLLLHGKNPQEARKLLMEVIAQEDTSNGHRSIQTTEFAVSMLKAWIAPDKDLILFRNQLLAVAQRIPQNQWNILHWACLTASYPFLLNFSEVTGRLFFLQSEISRTQILSRLQDIYGGREAVERALRYALGTMICLGFIIKKNTLGIHIAPKKILITDKQLGLLLWKAILHATQGNKIAVSTLRNAPALYAFNIPNDLSVNRVDCFPDLNVHQFMDESLLVIE